jgi:hypothetical protein
VLWVHNAVAGVRAAHRPAGGPWAKAAAVCPGTGIVLDWDVALADGGRALAAVSRVPHFKATYGASTCFMNKAGHWAAPVRVTAATDGPRVGLSNTDGVVAWLAAPGLRARATVG